MEKVYLDLMRKKRRFVIYAIIFAFLFYFMLPVSLTLFPEQMNQTSFLPGMSWAWLYAFLQILMIWLLGWIYHLRAKKLDELAKQFMREE